MAAPRPGLPDKPDVGPAGGQGDRGDRERQGADRGGAFSGSGEAHPRRLARRGGYDVP